MHTYDEWLVWHKSGAAVHFTEQSAALTRFGDHPDAVRMEHVTREFPCSKPERGYCGLCYPFREHAGNPDFTASNAFIPASAMNL